MKKFNSERIYWAVEQVERVAGDIDDLHLDDNLFYLKSDVDELLLDKENKIRMLQRALFKSCSNWAHFAVAFFSSYATKERWRKMENKCIKKLEEKKCLL